MAGRLAGTIAIDGSSTVYPVTEAVAEEFQNATGQKVKVTVGISGTGGGFKKFARGETDISDASRPILKAEMETAKEAGIEFVELPVCFDALTVAVHPDADWVDSITVEELKKSGSRKPRQDHWNQIRRNGQTRSWCCSCWHRSGTFDTEAINGVNNRGDFTAVRTTTRSADQRQRDTGHIPYAYYAQQSKMKTKDCCRQETGVNSAE
jgi:phosphate transport system substrate-binding protein